MLQPLCTVRSCALPLAREERRYVCANHHSFDIARSGYCNLLQPQDKRSKEPGDARAAVEARRRFFDRGFAKGLQRGLKEMLPHFESVLDVGCGEGSHLAAMASGDDAIGIDISTSAIDLAAKAYCGNRWFVANADRFIPFPDRSFDLILSITGRMNAPEFQRVLREDGHLLIAVSARDDLIEIGGAGRDRVTRTIETFRDFSIIDQRRIATVVDLDDEAATDILAATYRPRQAKAARVTLSLDALLFRNPKP